ncbi:putative ankyrin repeat protein [Colletotrichum sp. SAR 10_76]|nr:putative ankyrin repeat protein [Colletotrichum sp. SAR 10_76]
MPRSKRLHTDDPEWIRRKPAIEMMYVFDRLSQKKIRDKLEEDGFFVTKSELEAQLHFWNIRKNASADVWRYTDHRLLKREQQGKVSVVYYNRKQVSCNTLKKERSRYQPDALTKYTTAESPKTPEGMELCICTPPAAPTQSRWPQTLPWIRFQDSILLIPSRTASDFAVNIASMMPENAENEIANRAQLIVQGTAEQAINEHIKLILYCLSNNMYEINYGDDSSWLTVVNLINRSGLTNWPLDLAQQKDLTIASIAEKLFMLCIETAQDL